MTPVRIVSPEGSTSLPAARRAESPVTLADQKLAVLDNGKPNARLLMQTIAERIAELHGATVAIVTAKATAATPAEPEILQQLAAADLVITGSAD